MEKMSEFTKKAEAKGPKIYKVRDYFELFKNGEADIKIYSGTLDNREDWIMIIPWNYAEGKYFTDKIPNEILDSIVLRNLVLAEPVIHLYV